MWLASTSYRVSQHHIVPTSRWTPARWIKQRKMLDWASEDVGIPGHFRLFRMQVTLCKHVPLTDAEIEGLPEEWKACAAMDLAGGPVEALDSFGLPDGLLSVQPCVNPTKHPMPGLDYDDELWFPLDCGTCNPCLARKVLEGAPA